MEWEPTIPEGWGNQHQAFLQALMARGSVSLPEAQPILAAIFNQSRGDDEPEIDPETITKDDLEELVEIARRAVEPLDFDIRKQRHQVTKEESWAFVNVNVKEDVTMQLATAHTADEIAFIKRLLDAIFDTHNTTRIEAMCITEDQALKLSRPARSRESNAGDAASSAPGPEKALRHSEVLALMVSLVEEGWLEKSRAGLYSLTPRALMELSGWAFESYNDADASSDDWQRIKTCVACKEILTVGQRCADMMCNVRLHDICAEAFWRSRKNSKRCPKCDRAWEGKHFVGERAVTRAAGYQRGRERGGGGRGGPSRPAASAIQEEADKYGDGDHGKEEER